MKKLVMIETVSMHRTRYVVQADSVEDAVNEFEDNLESGDFKEFSQLHIGENLMNSFEISDADYIKEFDRDNEYLQSWSDDVKRRYINVASEQKLD